MLEQVDTIAGCGTYLDLIRNFRRYSWLLIYLFGASPAVCASFLRGRENPGLVPFDEQGRSLHLPYGTALRMGAKEVSIVYRRSEDEMPARREEIERIVTDRVENALAVVPNVEEIRSRSEEGQSRVTLEFAQGTNIDEAANDVRAALDRIRDDLPPEVESPRLWKFDPDNFPVVILGARSDLGMEEMTRILEREVSQRFEQIPGAGSVDVWGGVYREIQVQLKRDRLASSRLSARDVQEALLRENVTLPGGDLREGTRVLQSLQAEHLAAVDLSHALSTERSGSSGPMAPRNLAL